LSTIPLRFVEMRLLVLLLLLGLAAAAPAQAAPANVEVGDFFYRPFRVKVEPGEPVNWRVLDGTDHTITSDRGAPARFDSEGKAPGQTYSFRFTLPGRYRYVCEFHPGLMDGVVQVGDDTVDPVVTGVKARPGRRSVRLSFRVSEEVKAKATFFRAGKVVKTIRTKTLRQGARSVRYRPKILRPGRYRVKLAVRDLEGNAAKAVSKRFRIPRRATG
jgi:plastocyanin